MSKPVYKFFIFRNLIHIFNGNIIPFAADIVGVCHHSGRNLFFIQESDSIVVNLNGNNFILFGAITPSSIFHFEGNSIIFFRSEFKEHFGKFHPHTAELNTTFQRLTVLIDNRNRKRLVTIDRPVTVFYKSSNNAFILYTFFEKFFTSDAYKSTYLENYLIGNIIFFFILFRNDFRHRNIFCFCSRSRNLELQTDGIQSWIAQIILNPYKIFIPVNGTVIYFDRAVFILYIAVNVIPFQWKFITRLRSNYNLCKIIGIFLKRIFRIHRTAR